MERFEDISLIYAADSGDKIATLKALRHKLASKIQDCESGRDLAALSRQLRDVMEDIANAEAVEERRRGSNTLELIRGKYK